MTTRPHTSSCIHGGPYPSAACLGDASLGPGADDLRPRQDLDQDTECAACDYRLGEHIGQYAICPDTYGEAGTGIRPSWFEELRDG